MARRSTCLLAAAVVTLLSGCTLEPNYQRPPSPVPALDGGAAGGTVAADIGWREFFPDPQLQQLIALTLANNRDLRVAILNVQSAQAQYRIQRAQLFPAIDASAVEQAQRIPIGVLEAENPNAAAAAIAQGAGSALPSGITVHTYDVGVGFTSFELDLFGRIRSLSHAALQQYFSSGETRQSVQLTLVAEVATAYITVLADQTLLDITRDTLKSQEASYALTQKAVRPRSSRCDRPKPRLTRHARTSLCTTGSWQKTAMRCSFCSARRFRTAWIFPAAWTAETW
jgi:multidrug efflux system outer membrane protein